MHARTHARATPPSLHFLCSSIRTGADSPLLGSGRLASPSPPAISLCPRLGLLCHDTTPHAHGSHVRLVLALPRYRTHRASPPWLRDLMSLQCDCASTVSVPLYNTSPGSCLSTPTLCTPLTTALTLVTFLRRYRWLPWFSCPTNDCFVLSGLISVAIDWHSTCRAVQSTADDCVLLPERKPREDARVRVVSITDEPGCIPFGTIVGRRERIHRAARIDKGIATAT
ncbi:hypothetical protein OH77DRAFT_223683 [Trametes cingulata]|nr:hypothetical protein OH77DRAFT_223683 [Trametes cingulata]